ncbi:MAG: hypothetical protein ACFFKA_21145, partial [Candidatus Thorarchaeota archaeon]
NGNHKKKELKMVYSNKQLIEDLRKEIENIRPQDLRGNRLPNWKLCKFLNLPFDRENKKWDSVSEILCGKRGTSLYDLKVMKKSLNKYFSNKVLIDYLNKFEKINFIVKDTNGKEGKNVYTTLNLIADLRNKVSKLMPFELYRGELAYWKLSKYIYDKNSKKGYDFIQQAILPRFNPKSKVYNPNYKFSHEILQIFIRNLTINFGNKADTAINHIKHYMQLNPNLKNTSYQQWHLTEPKMLINYFSAIDTIEKAYWLGFLMADGSILTRYYYYQNGNKYLRKTPKKVIFIEISKRDKELLYHFCASLRINRSKVKFRSRRHYKSHNIHHYAYLSIVNNNVAKDLEEQGFASSKRRRKLLPSFYKIMGLNVFELLLAFTRGYYDGDGFSGTTRICSTSKQFLIRLKYALKIKYNVSKSNDSKVYKDELGKFHIERAQYSLAIGAHLFNEMTRICKESNINLLRRKDKSFSQTRDSLTILKKKFKKLGISKDILQDLVFQYRTFELVKRFNTTRYSLKKLLDEWKISLPPNGYWKKRKD